MDDAAIAELLAEVRRAREGRDLWRQVGPALAELKAAGVSYRRIKREAGVSPSTVARIVRTGASTRSTTAA